MPRTTLYLVRHGEQGTGESISNEGRAQARALGRRLAGTKFDAIHYSSVQRAAETAQILTAPLSQLSDVPAHACDLVKDRTPILASSPERYRAFLAEVPEEERDPGAEKLQDAVRRLGALGPQDRTDLVVTHNFVIGWFVRHVLQAPDWRWLGLNQANCGLTIVAWETGRPATLIAFNDTGHLPPLGY